MKKVAVFKKYTGFKRTKDEEQDREIKKIKYSIKKLKSDIEFKYTGSIIAASTISASGTFVSSIIAGIVQGTTETSRVGKTITVHSIEVKYEFAMPNDAVVFEEAVGWYLLIDKQPNGATPAVLDVLSTASYITIKNNETRSRFKILKQGLNALPNTSVGAATYSAANVVNHFFIKFKKPFEIQFNGNAGTVADLVTNNILFLTVSKNGKAKMTGYIRVKFADS